MQSTFSVIGLTVRFNLTGTLVTNQSYQAILAPKWLACEARNYLTNPVCLTYEYVQLPDGRRMITAAIQARELFWPTQSLALAKVR